MRTLVGSLVLVGSVVGCDMGLLGPALDPGRVVEPTYGFAVSFPDDWAVEKVTARREDEFLGPDRIPGEAFPLRARQTGGDGFCHVRLREFAEGDEQFDLDAWAADAEPGISGMLRDRSRSSVSLPVGPAWRVDGTLADGSSASFYLIWRPRVSYTLQCAASDPPDDRWLSIAESFEFLPAEE